MKKTAFKVFTPSLVHAAYAALLVSLVSFGMALGALGCALAALR